MLRPVVAADSPFVWTQRFEAFAARKVAEAVHATIPGYQTLEDRSRGFALDAIGNTWTDARFDGPFFESRTTHAGVPLLSAVFVQSADKNTGSDHPTELGGGETDAHLIYEGLSRVHADAVMAGATTIRGSQTVLAVWHPELVRLRDRLGLGRYPAQVVTTETGRIDMDAALMFNVATVPVFVLTTDAGARTLRAQAATRPWVHLISTGERSDVVSGLRTLRAEHGIARVSAIGGRTLVTALIDAGAVRDVYLTTSARSGGAPNTPYYTGSHALRTELVVRKRGLADEEGVVFEHLVVR
jgi:riboflavin biosynthesis pyrimidine reductase